MVPRPTKRGRPTDRRRIEHWTWSRASTDRGRITDPFLGHRCHSIYAYIYIYIFRPDPYAYLSHGPNTFSPPENWVIATFLLDCFSHIFASINQDGLQHSQYGRPKVNIIIIQKTYFPNPWLVPQWDQGALFWAAPPECGAAASISQPSLHRPFHIPPCVTYMSERTLGSRVSSLLDRRWI